MIDRRDLSPLGSILLISLRLLEKKIRFLTILEYLLMAVVNNK